MSKLHARHLLDALRDRYLGVIDLADVANADDTQQAKVFATRALAALALHRLTGVDPTTAAAAVVDGTGDNGIDAIYVDPDNTLILIQAKWDYNGTAGIGLGEARNFIAGLKDLTDERYDRFNEKFQQHVPEIEAALADPYVNFVLVVATSGTSDLADPVAAAFADMEQEMNDTQPLVRLERLGLREFHADITSALRGERIDLSVTLENFGVVTEPFEAFYGTVAAGAIAEWYAAHGDQLFEQNLRKPLGNTTVNQALAQTLTHDPAHFWYFNNGITALCESIRKGAKGASSRTYGEFALSGVQVVNGAQTVAAISRSAREMVKNEDDVEPRVWVRFISLEGCPPEFASEVTRATNTQNAVERSDFVALDPEQSRLRTELLLSLQKTYSIKRGEVAPPQEHGCTVAEATVALACSQQDSSLAVIAKSAVGRLWESTERAPYRTLFNTSTSAVRLWRVVQVTREVDKRLEEQRRQLDGRGRSVAVQGNRVALHIVFLELDMTRIDDADADWDTELAKVPAATDAILELLVANVEAMYPSNYITSLFKNASRCEALVRETAQQRA